MIGSATSPIQAALFTRLNADATLTGKVFDEVPDKQAPPYTVIGEFTETTSGIRTLDKDGAEVTATIHIYSRKAGMKEGQDILTKIVSLLDNYALPVSGYGLVLCHYEGSEQFQEEDGFTRHTVARFRVVVQEA